MTNSLRLILLLWISIFTAQCRSQGNPVIRGNITLTSSWKPMVYLIQPRSFKDIATSYTATVLDSTPIAADGNFAFLRLPNTPGELLLEICLQTKDSRFPNKLLNEDPDKSNYMPLVLQSGEQIEINAMAERFQATFSINNPSAQNSQLLRLRDLRLQGYSSEATLLAKHKAASEESDLLMGEAALKRFQTPLMAFADSSAYLYPALLAARWVSPEGDYERVPEFIFKLCETWRAKMSDNQYVMQVCELAKPGTLPILTGEIMPSMPLPMLDGDTMQLHALLGKKLTILDIWASWCQPCRLENREILAPLWKTYQNDGLQILGYALDSNRKGWESAIIKDQASWPQASHLSGDATPLLQSLRITTIPANFLLDENGRILAKNLHGADLRAFVENYLKR